MNAKRNAKRAQGIMEYVLLAVMIVSAALGMQVYIKRGIQAKVKDMADTMLGPGAVDKGQYQVANLNKTIPLLDTKTGLSGESRQNTVIRAYTDKLNTPNPEIVYEQHPQQGATETSVSISYQASMDPSKTIDPSKKLYIPKKPPLPVNSATATESGGGV